MRPYIDIHTHKAPSRDQSIIQFFNQIIGKKHRPTSSYSVGIHPCYISPDYDKQYQLLEHIVTDPNVIAIGECGLDKNSFTTWDRQLKTFRKQIQLANELQKALVIHCVRSYDEVTNILNIEKTKVPVLFHGVNKKQSLLLSLINRGFYISLGEFIRRGNHDDFIKTVDLAYICLETDNSPACIKDIYAYFCQIRNISLEQLQEQMVLNVEKIFQYKLRRQ